MGAIDMLKTDHRKIRRLFARFDALEPNDYASQENVVGELVRTLHTHAAIEEDIFYPQVAEAKAEPSAQVDDASKEHEHMDQLADELARMSATDRGFRNRFDNLRTSLMAHMKEEEREMLPAAARAIDSDKMADIGRSMQDERDQLERPTHH